jgi:hypothetical protein
MSQSIFCTASSHTQAVRILNRLKSADVRGDAISVVVPDGPAPVDTAGGEAAAVPQGARTVLDGALSSLADAGRSAIPGDGSVIAAGPIVAALAGAEASGLVGALVGLGVDGDDARRFDTEVRQGSILISVHSGSPKALSRAKLIFEDCDGESIAVADAPGVGSA